jgi:terminase large subunit-like protein
MSETESVAQPVVEPAAAPKMRGRGTDLSSLTSEELKKHKRDIDGKSRKSRNDRKKAASYVFDSATEPTKSEAKELLGERGLKHPHVIDTVYKLLLREAEAHNVPANRFLFANGIAQTLRSYEAKVPQQLSEISAEPIAGELLTRAELHALYDASIATHEDITFEEFLSIRLRCKSDTFFLGKEVFKNDFAHCHEVWRDFFPQWNPLTLPPNYTQKQAIDWLSSQSEVKDFLLMASRRAFKSSFARLWLVSAIVTLPDIRVLVVSETRPLAKDNIEAVRGYFETTPGFETRFNRLFPEFCMPVGDGSVMSLEVPTRRLKLPQSIESSSMDSTVAGRRADIILFDDPISEVSCTNEVQIQKSVNKRDMLVKLKERGGFVITLGTPYAAQDLYFVMIERSKKNNDETFAYRVDPAFSVKPHALHKLTVALLPTLEESDIEEFLFPEGLPWKELRVDMRNNPPFFMSQNLCIFPLGEDDELRCQFDHDELWARVRPSSYFGSPIVAQTVMALDRAFSVSRYADFSCCVVGRLQPVDGTQALVIVDSKMDRWRESDLVRSVTDLIEKHRPTIFVAEQDRGWETLAQSIREQCLRRGIPVPYFRWKVISPTDRAKAKRVKGLELPLSDGRLWFTTSHWTEAGLLQLEKFDGIQRSNSHRKDDFPDAVSLLYQELGPKYQEEVKTEDVEQRRMEEEEEGARERRRHFYNAMFSGDAPRPAPQPVEEPKPQDPRMRVFGNRGPWRL